MLPINKYFSFMFTIAKLHIFLGQHNNSYIFFLVHKLFVTLL